MIGWNDDPLSVGTEVDWDKTYWNILDRLPLDQAPHIGARAPLTPKGVEFCLKLMPRDIFIYNIFLNARDYADLRRDGRSHLEVETVALMLRAGHMATFWDKTRNWPVRVITPTKPGRVNPIPAGTVWFTARGDQLFEWDEGTETYRIITNRALKLNLERS